MKKKGGGRTPEVHRMAWTDLMGDGGTGWVKLPRGILESLVWRSPLAFKVFIWCVLRATYKRRVAIFDGKPFTLQPGQLVSGRFAGSEACNMPPGTFRNQLMRLRRFGYLDIESDNRKSIITVVNYEKLCYVTDTEDSSQATGRTARDHIQEGKEYREEREIIDGITLTPPIMARKSLERDSELSAVELFREFWVAEYRREHRDLYSWSKGDAVVVRKLLGEGFEIEELKRRALRYLGLRDPWLEENGHSVRNFSSMINKPAVTGSEKTKNKEIFYIKDEAR